MKQTLLLVFVTFLFIEIDVIDFLESDIERDFLNKIRTVFVSSA